MFWMEKNTFETKKSEVLKSLKMEIFIKGLVHGFCQKIENFVMGLFLGKSCQERPFFHTLDRKECFLEQNSKVLKKVQRIEIF